MSQASERHDEVARPGPAIRHRDVPRRQVGDKVVVARPLDGAPVVLAPTAAVIWKALDEWTTASGIDRRLAEVFPSVAINEREAARSQILVSLTDDDLLEQR